MAKLIQREALGGAGGVKRTFRRRTRRCRRAGPTNTCAALTSTLLVYTGAPDPHVLARSGFACVIYSASDPREGWGGTSVQVADSTGQAIESLGVLTFTGVHSVRFGGPNDEVLHGHPLAKVGLESYGFHEVMNSTWIGQEEQINSVHIGHQGGWHALLRHFIFTFHDDLLECLADDFIVHKLKGTRRQALDSAISRMLTGGD